MCCYLDGRCQRVRLHGYLSDFAHIRRCQRVDTAESARVDARAGTDSAIAAETRNECGSGYNRIKPVATQAHYLELSNPAVNRLRWRAPPFKCTMANWVLSEYARTKVDAPKTRT